MLDNLNKLKEELKEITEKLDRGIGYWFAEQVKRDERRRLRLIEEIKEIENVEKTS